MTVTIITDSTADLSPEIINNRQLKVVPLTVYIGGDTYLDGVNLSTQRLFELVEKYGGLPKTAAPSVGVFMEIFNQPGDYVFIGISTELSSTVQNATLASAEFPGRNIFLINSLNLSTGIGMLVLKAADLRDAGLSAAEIQEQVNKCIDKIRCSFVIETMEYLYKGGRCTALQSLFGSLLKIRPVIEVKGNGTMGVKDKIRGTRKKALDSMLVDLQANLDNLDLTRIFVTHTGCDADALYLADEIRKICPVKDIHITTAGAVVSSHCGPDTIGIIYSLK